MSEYEFLRLIWWALLGVLLIGFAVLDGFDLGTAALLPFVARNDVERRIVVNTVGPVWEGNQVWFIVGGGATFAAWPSLYAASFSGFYLAMFLVLLTLILRPVGFKFRSKVDAPLWRSFWDWALFSGGVVPALVFGVTFGNLFRGVPFNFDSDLRFHSTISLVSLLNPFALLVGFASLCMVILHGATWLNLKTDGPVQARARSAIPLFVVLFTILFAIAGFWISDMDGYRIAGQLAHDAPSNPLAKSVVLVKGGWLANQMSHSLLFATVALAYVGAAFAALFRRAPLVAFLASACVPTGTIATAGVALFPFLLPSSANPNASLTVWDASSSLLTLAVMLGAVVLILPVVLAYTAWVYRVMRGPVRAADIERNSKSAY